MKQKYSMFGKRELILIAAVLIVAAVTAAANRIFFSEPAAYVEISVVDENSQKQVLKTLDLSVDQEYTIKTGTDGFNHLVINDGEAWISTANCPNHDCVKKGKISRNGEMLVCIPHRLTVSIVSE